MSERQQEAIAQLQVEAALRLLEWNHGEALKYRTPREAAAFYEAIQIVEMALNEEFDHLEDSEDMKESLDRSREAREMGYKAATRFDEQFGYSDSKDGLLKRLSGSVFNND